MSTVKKQKHVGCGWSTYMRAVCITFFSYIAGIFLIAALILNGIVSESNEYVLIAMWCGVSSAIGSWVCAFKAGRGILVKALIPSGIMALVLGLTGICVGDPEWIGKGGGLLICSVTGGVVVGVACASKLSRKRGLH